MALDYHRCPAGVYWVRYKDRAMPQKPKLMECQNGGTWWYFGWDIPERDMDKYDILAEVEPYKGLSRKRLPQRNEKRG